MQNLRTICTAIIVSLSAVPSVWAAGTAALPPFWAKPVKPFAALSLPKTPLSFGDAPQAGGKRIVATLKATVYANHPYRVAVAFSGLTQGKGLPPIPSEKLTVRINGKPAPVGKGTVEIATGPGTTVKGVEIPVTIDVEFKDATTYRAGQYGGNLTFSIK
jgi:hypothetical protein